MSLLLRPFRQARNLNKGLYLLNARNGSYDLTPQKAPDGTPYLAKRFGDEVGPIPRPKGGETWVYQGEGSKSQDWRADGHRWVNQGTVGLPRKNPRLKKKYFYIQTENGASKDFVKFVYHEPNSNNGPFFIHYIGNEEASKPLTHGNSKNERAFIRSKPSSLDKWLTKTKTEDPNIVYKKEVQDEEEQPRNLKQLQNLRHKGNTELRISRDALYNLHALARDTSNQFIHVINTFPNLVVICGHKMMFEELERVMYLDSKTQCLSYDTTFQLSQLLYSHVFHVIKLSSSACQTSYWRNLYLVLGPLPVLAMYLYCEHFGEDVHPTREYIKGYDHMQIRTRTEFPWGTTKTLFHNKWINRLPDGYEEMTPEEMAEIEKHHGGHH
ncbi:hypothetical protein FSP39_001254 [Pinctada imbricata]|uniref:Uncharacterized protein n=1 Tax=Pinctada imbricata TaxID=66713 RepID=A0AA88XEC3_PINIB|nr:hypothetical protein FSP39_001254 [Pinctada imbricata]